MKKLISHIEFLLHTHNCVVVPDLGGFVVNVVPATCEGVSSFNAPACELAFNRDLHHNDGLLAQSFMKTDGISFELATKAIEQEVQELKKQLREKRMLDLGKLGTFTMHDDARFVYTPTKFVRPAFYGLSKASLKPHIQMPVPVMPVKNEIRKLRRFSARAAAVVAAGMILFFLPTNDWTENRQTAQLFSDSWSSRSIVDADVASEPATVYEVAMLPTTDHNVDMVPSAHTNIEQRPSYHLVVGVFQHTEGATTTLNRLRTSGITEASKIVHGGRYYVTAASHNCRNSAQAGLRRLHRNHPEYFDAWVFNN